MKSIKKWVCCHRERGPAVCSESPSMSRELRRTSELKACILGSSKPRRLAAMVNKTEQLIPRLPPFWGWQLVQLRCTARSVGPLYGE